MFTLSGFVEHNLGNSKVDWVVCNLPIRTLEMRTPRLAGHFTVLNTMLMYFLTPEIRTPHTVQDTCKGCLDIVEVLLFWCVCACKIPNLSIQLYHVSVYFSSVHYLFYVTRESLMN